MVGNLLMYVLLAGFAVAAFWYGARVIGVARPASGPSGLGWLDAENAFDRARQRHRRHRLVAVLLRRPHRLDLPVLSDSGTLGLPGPRNPREQHIALRDVVGSVDGGAGKFDRDFLPTDDHSRWRFQQIVVAIRGGAALPPIEVYRHAGRYYVLDGHHRVAVARALDETSIPAHVTEIVGAPFPSPRVDDAAPAAAPPESPARRPTAG